MKSKLKLALASAAVTMLFASPAWSADAPASTTTQAGSKPAASAPASAEKTKRTATPHNHMRDAKGMWVAEKKPRKVAKKSDTEAGKAPAEGEAKK
jgi:hypothetical protein